VATQAEHQGALSQGFKGRLAAVLLAAVLLAGCTGPAVNTGPFRGGGDPGEECASIPPGGVLGYGFEEFRNGGSATATIDKVALTDPRGLRIVAAYVVPVSGHILYGVQPGWPPAYIPPGFHWPQREKAVGARIPPSPGHDVINLLLVLKPTGRVGTARSVDVYYRASGQDYHLRTVTSIRVIAARSC
jgi:hypothetical protein